MTPQFFCISDIGNSLSDCSQSMKKICIVEVFRANVLKTPRCQDNYLRFDQREAQLTLEQWRKHATKYGVIILSESNLRSGLCTRAVQRVLTHWKFYPHNFTAAVQCRKHQELYNFGDSLRNWVKVFYTEIESAVINNGFATNWFKPTSGVRQGCPLSPYLFILTAELMSTKLGKATRLKAFNCTEMKSSYVNLPMTLTFLCRLDVCRKWSTHH